MLTFTHSKSTPLALLSKIKECYCSVIVNGKLKLIDILEGRIHTFSPLLILLLFLWWPFRSCFCLSCPFCLQLTQHLLCRWLQWFFFFLFFWIWSSAWLKHKAKIVIKWFNFKNYMCLMKFLTYFGTKQRLLLIKDSRLLNWTFKESIKLSLFICRSCVNFPCN